jgi:hypothetical protein
MRLERAGLLQPTTTKAQINLGLSLSLDEKRGSRHRPNRILSRSFVHPRQ